MTHLQTIITILLAISGLTGIYLVDVFRKGPSIWASLLAQWSRNRRYGMLRIHNDLSYLDLFRSLNSGDELLWLDTYAPPHQVFIHELREALRRGAAVRMLVVDPDCDNSKYRAREITVDSKGKPTDDFEYDKFRDSINAFIRQLRAAAEQLDRDEEEMHIDDMFSIHLYRDLPGVPMYIIRRRGSRELVRGYTSMYLSRATAFEPHIEWGPTKGNRGMLAMLEQFFEEKWERQDSPNGRGVYPVTYKAERKKFDDILKVAEVQTLLVEVGKGSPSAGIERRLVHGLKNDSVRRELATKRYAVASIPPGVESETHVHFKGDEAYFVYSGQGEVRLSSPVSVGRSGLRAPAPEVCRLDSSSDEHRLCVITAGTAHSLHNVDGNAPLKLIMACPPANLDVFGDRYSVTFDLDTQVPVEKTSGDV